MKTKDLKINFRYLDGNIACLSVDSVDGKRVHNDIDNEEAIIIFNSLVGEKENCQTVKTLLKENQELKKQLEEANEKIILLQASEPMLNYKKSLEKTQQKEFIKYLEDYLKLFDKMNIDEQIIYDTIEEILQKYKEIIGGDN